MDDWKDDFHYQFFSYPVDEYGERRDTPEHFEEFIESLLERQRAEFVEDLRSLERNMLEVKRGISFKQIKEKYQPQTRKGE